VALTQYREGDQLIDVVWRGGLADARSLEHLPDLDIPLPGGRHVPLAQLAKLVPVQEEGLIWRRNRLPTMTVRADMSDETQQPATISKQLDAEFDAVRAKMPIGYRIEMGGSIEESAKNQAAIMKVMPLMLVGVFTLLMIQLQSISRSVIVFLTAPLGLIGVTLALLIFRVPFGFVANLGFIALAGMIMRNAVILVDQIRHEEEGKTQWQAIVSSTVRRFRPIMLTASAAILAMIPLTRQVFWGPMAVSIMGGLVVATLLTCLFLPALYAAWFRVKEE
jgi:multidrug efflux pump